MTPNKRNNGSTCQQSNTLVNSKKMGAKNQIRSSVTDGIAPHQDNVASQKHEKELSNHLNHEPDS